MVERARRSTVWTVCSSAEVSSASLWAAWKAGVAPVSVWAEMDKAARPVVRRELRQMGWVLHGEGGNHQWTAWRREVDTDSWTEGRTSITAMNPFSLIERVAAHEKKLEQKRRRRAEREDWSDGLD